MNALDVNDSPERAARDSQQGLVGLPTAALLILAAMVCVNAGMRDDSAGWKLFDIILAYACIRLALTVTRKQPNI